ncbi:MAG: hypothetical protein NZ960_03905 [Candidatus Kapabacteria bacterium]|nr:hypothetical protein [Candidatus Kapabacteria bacterium]MDW8012201.1 hypothetical protein [Bacteroidota bacterium]
MRFRGPLVVAVGVCLLGTVALQGPHVHSPADGQSPEVQQSCWLCWLPPLVLPDLPEAGRLFPQDVVAVEQVWEQRQAPYCVSTAPLCCRAPPRS